MQVKVKAQDRDGFFVTIPSDANSTQLIPIIADQIKLPVADVDQTYKIVHQNKLLTSQYPIEAIFEDPEIVLLKKRVIPKRVIPQSNVSIEKQIQQRMEKYLAPPVVIELDEEKVMLLQSMGFSESRARKALILNLSNTEDALNWLLQKEDDPTVDEPLTQAQLRKISKKIAFVCDETLVTMLLEMGFQRDAIERALRATNNNLDAACIILAEEREVPAIGEDFLGEDVVLNDPRIIRILSDPRMAQVFEEITNDPQSLPVHLANPETGPLLLEFVQIMRIPGGRQNL